MNKKELKYLIFLFITLIGMVLVELFGPKETDFTPDFSNTKDIPYGCSALFETFPNYFNHSFSSNQNPIYNFYQENADDSLNYLIITSSFQPDEPDLNKMLQLVENGSCFFIAALNFNQTLLDTLNLEQIYHYQLNRLLKSDTTSTMILDHAGNEHRFVLTRNANYTAFNTDSIEVDTLGVNGYGNPNLIKVKFGNGSFILCSQPFIFTNIHFLDSNVYRYSELAFSYLPELPVVWDEYYKPNIRTAEASPMRFILKTPALRLAWYALLLALFVYLFFGSRRLQRTVPVIEPPVNSSLEFTSTLGRLYFHGRNHLDLVDKKMMHFQVFINEKFRISNKLIGEDLYAKIAAKSGISKKEITAIFTTYHWIKSRESISDIELTRFVSLINKFYKDFQTSTNRMN